MQRAFLSLYASVLLLLAPVLARATVDTSKLPFTVRCEQTRGHHDGDTFACVSHETDLQSFVVRFAGVDAPETGQAHWRASREMLRKLAAPGAKVSCYKKDIFQRFVCRVQTPNGQDAADEMLLAGLAWHSVEYAREQTPSERARYAELEVKARNARRGLFAEPDPQRPSECRRAKKQHVACR